MMDSVELSSKYRILASWEKDLRNKAVVTAAVTELPLDNISSALTSMITTQYMSEELNWHW
jgi:hypothetical protein